MGDLVDQILARQRELQRTGVMPPNPAVAGAFERRHGPATTRPSAPRASVSPPLTPAQEQALARAMARLEAERLGQGQPSAASQTPLLDALLAQMEAEGRSPPQGARPPTTGAAAPSPDGLTPEARAAITAEGPRATYEQIMTALRNAHAAGDAASAQRLARMAQEARAREEALRLLDEMDAREAGQPAAGGAAGGASGAPLQAQLPNGVIVEFPAGTAQDVMSGAIDRLIMDEEAKQPGWSGLTPQQLEGIRRRVDGQATPALTSEQRAEYDTLLARIDALRGPQIPGQGITPGLDANSYGAPPSNASALSALLTPEGQAARRQAGVDALMPPTAEPGYDANGLPIPAAGDVPSWALAARQAAGEGVVPYAPGTPIPDNPAGRNWLDSRGAAWDAFLYGDNDPTTMSGGEAFGAALNKAGEAMTLGLVGDEAAGWFDHNVLGRGASAEERTQAYRDQEAQLWSQHPGLALAAEIGGGVLGPGKGVGAVINRGVGAASRIGRGLLAGVTAGAVYGTADAESDALPMQGDRRGGTEDRIAGGLLGAVTGGLGGAAVTGIGQGFLRAAQALRGAPGGREVAVTVEGLEAAAQRLYAQAKASGVTIPQPALTRLATGTTNALRGEGYHPRLHPRIGAVLEELQELASAPASLARIDIARRVAGAAAKSLEPDERRLASLVIDRIDDVVASLGDGSAALREARSLWARMSRLERIEGLMEDAANSKDFVGTMASRLRTFLRNPRNLRGFSEAERRMMEQIARGGSVGVRALKGLADLLAPSNASGLGAMVGAGYAANPVAAILPPIASYGARAAGNALGRSQINALGRMVGMTDEQRAFADAFLGRPNALAGLAGPSTPRGLLDYLSPGEGPR